MKELNYFADVAPHWIKSGVNFRVPLLIVLYNKLHCVLFLMQESVNLSVSVLTAALKDANKPPKKNNTMYFLICFIKKIDLGKFMGVHDAVSFVHC